MSYRKLLGPSALLLTLAAPVAAQADEMMPGVYAHDWSGFYIGAHIGGLWGDAASDYEGGAISDEEDIDGLIGGGQAGYNWQNGNWVYGIEGDIAATGANVDLFGDIVTFDVDWLATIRGRIGHASGATLYYLTAGIAFADLDLMVGINSESNTHTGFVAGGGIEHAFADNLSARIEYNYVSLGDEVYFDGNVPNVDLDAHVLKIGVNWYFQPR